MAARTLTYTINMQESAKNIVKGLNALSFDFNSGATKFGTLSDVALLGKIPNGALVTQATLGFGGAPNDAAHYDFLLLAIDDDGTYSTHATLIGSTTVSAAVVVRMDRPVKVSLSDDRINQHVVLALNCTTGASETVSTSFYGHVNFLTDGSSV